MQIFDHVETVLASAPLVAHSLARLLPLLSERVNKRAVRLIKAKNMQRRG
jgi:hypothetical protein